MRKTVALILLMAMMLSLCACGGRAEKKEAPAPAATAEPTPEPTPSPMDKYNEAKAMFDEGNYSDACLKLSELENEGLPEAEELMGECLYYGYGTDVDYDRAVEVLEYAAKDGSVIAQFLLAEAEDTGRGTVQNKEEAQKDYLDFVIAASAVGSGDPSYASALAYLAKCYNNGLGVDRYSGRAVENADKAAALADSLKPFELAVIGSIYEDQHDDDKADKYYTKCETSISSLAENGNAHALKLMGDFFFKGFAGHEQDYEQAIIYYKRAADSGLADAQAQLGYIYMNGCGVEADYEQAMEWNNRAAMQGNAQGQAQIGYLYQMGLGVTKSNDEASRWYKKAADQGNQWASEQFAVTDAASSYANFQAHA